MSNTKTQTTTTKDAENVIESIPAGMTECSGDEFVAKLKADPRDIMPNTNDRNFSNWTTKNGVIVGWSAPGWANAGHPEMYAWRE